MHSITTQTAEYQADAATSQETQSRQQQLSSNSRNADPAALQQLLQHAEQLNSWVAELLELQAATAAAATAIAHDPGCSPALLLDAAAAEMHPVWAKDHAAWSAAAAAAAAAGVGGITSDAMLAAASAGVDIPYPHTASTGRGSNARVDPAGTESDRGQFGPRFMLPAQPELHVGQGASLSVLQHYRAAAAALYTDQATQSSSSASTIHQADSDSSRSSSGSSNGDSNGSPIPVASGATTAAGPGPVLPWPLTAAASKVLLGSPLGVLPGPWLQQVYCLGLLGRVAALADAVDLARLVGGELAAAQVRGGMGQG
jgi:hypothetical protein